MQKTCQAVATRLAEVPHAISNGHRWFLDRCSGRLLSAPRRHDALVLGPRGRLGDALDGKLRRAIRVKQTVSLLIGIGELGVAKTGQKRKLAHCFQEPGVGLFQSLGGLDLAVPPGFTALVWRSIGDPAELGEHDWLTGVFVATQGGEASTR